MTEELCIGSGATSIMVTTSASASGIADAYADDGSWGVFDSGVTSTAYASIMAKMQGGAR
jgi:hypothetical protein